MKYLILFSLMLTGCTRVTKDSDLNATAGQTCGFSNKFLTLCSFTAISYSEQTSLGHHPEYYGVVNCPSIEDYKAWVRGDDLVDCK